MTVTNKHSLTQFSSINVLLFIQFSHLISEKIRKGDNCIIICERVRSLHNALLFTDIYFRQTKMEYFGMEISLTLLVTELPFFALTLPLIASLSMYQVSFDYLQYFKRYAPDKLIIATRARHAGQYMPIPQFWKKQYEFLKALLNRGNRAKVDKKSQKPSTHCI